MQVCEALDKEFVRLHVAKEDSFWTMQMGLTGNSEEETKDYAEKKNEWSLFMGSAKHLKTCQNALAELDDNTPDEVKASLENWVRTFNVNALHDEEAQKVNKQVLDLEATITAARTNMKLGYIDPKSGEFVEASSLKLSHLITNNDDEGIRKAAWEGLRSIEKCVMDAGYADLVILRNKLARTCGYKNYFEMKVQQKEGMSAQDVFDHFDVLENRTRERAKENIAGLKHSECSVKPWNVRYMSSGSISKEIEPYYRFETSLETWISTFGRMGVDYCKSSNTLDLVDRPGKYENGFCHGPKVSYTDIQTGEHYPAKTNFATNANPGVLGSGINTIRVLLHEGGHAAHFAGCNMPSPSYCHEFEPTSTSFAETHSMFLESVMRDGDWNYHYARNKEGHSIPLDLLAKKARISQGLASFSLRCMICIPVCEYKLYLMSDSELKNHDLVMDTIRKTETLYSQMPEGASRPFLSIPHPLVSESAAYYQSYILAEMAVEQTRNYFLKRDGYLCNNTSIGGDVRKAYYVPGNSKTFNQYIKDLTGEDLSPIPLADFSAMSADDRVEEIKASYNQAASKAQKLTPLSEIRLNGEIQIVSGNEEICHAAVDENPEELCRLFKEWGEKLIAEGALKESIKH